MIKTEIYDLNNCFFSNRNGDYTGMAGSKEGILIDNEPWMVKYPKNTKGMRGNLATYTTAPLSEYLGSQIYKILGYDVHETILGFRNKKIVVACKDFCTKDRTLKEFRAVKNIYNDKLNEALELEMSSTGSSNKVDINEVKIHLKYNPIFAKVEGIKERFWDCIIIDGLINNNDRNNGNWGLLKEDCDYYLSPIYDNGASFSTKLPDFDIAKKLSNEEAMKYSSLNTMSGYSLDDKLLSFKDLIYSQIEEEGFNDALKRNVPLIIEHFDKIKELINSVPESYLNITVCSDIRKQFYINGMKLRLENILIPAYEQVIRNECELEI